MPCRRRRGVVVSASARVGCAAASSVRREPHQILYRLAPEPCKCGTVRSGGRFPIKGVYWPLRPFDDPERRLRRRCALGLNVEGGAGRLSSVEELQVRHTAGVDLVVSQECVWTTAAGSASRLLLPQQHPRNGKVQYCLQVIFVTSRLLPAQVHVLAISVCSGA